MRFVQKWSYCCSNYLAVKQGENHEKKRIYYYGFQIIIGALVKGVLLTASTLLLGTFLSTTIVVLIFSSLRVIAGGYHMDTYGKCLGVSLGLFVVAGVTAQYTYEYWTTTSIFGLVLVAFLTALVAVLKWAPSDTPNKPITDPTDINRFKRLSVAYTLVWLALVIVQLYFRISARYILPACFGLLLEVFTITPLGYRFFSKVSGEMDRIKKLQPN